MDSHNLSNILISGSFLCVLSVFIKWRKMIAYVRNVETHETESLKEKVACCLTLTRIITINLLKNFRSLCHCKMREVLLQMMPSLLNEAVLWKSTFNFNNHNKAVHTWREKHRHVQQVPFKVQSSSNNPMVQHGPSHVCAPRVIYCIEKLVVIIKLGTSWFL